MNNLTISDIISPLRSLISDDMYDRILRELTFRESRLNFEKNDVLLKLQRATTDYNILSKNFTQLNSEHGELLIQTNESAAALKEFQSERITLEFKLAAEGEKVRKVAAEMEEMRALREREKEEMARKNKRLERDVVGIADAAGTRIRGFDKRVVELERMVGLLKAAFDEEKKGSAGANGTIVNPEVLGKSQLVVEKTTSSDPFHHNWPSSQVPIYNIIDSDEENESKGLKRKLVSPEASYQCGGAKNVQTFLKQCQGKAESLGMKNSATGWENEADMVADLEENTELCMKAVCALYRQHVTRKPSFAGFSAVDVFRGTTLGKFLVNGVAVGGLRKSAAELEKVDPDGASTCRRIALNHSKQLFEIYKDREDPNFDPCNQHRGSVLVRKQ